MKNFFRKILTLHAVLILLVVSSSCMPQKTLVNRDRLAENSSSHLSQRALDEYRKGNLAGAISIWKSILEFDPNNAGVAKSIDTATIQLKNLQQKTE